MNTNLDMQRRNSLLKKGLFTPLIVIVALALSGCSRSGLNVEIQHGATSSTSLQTTELTDDTTTPPQTPDGSASQAQFGPFNLKPGESIQAGHLQFVMQSDGNLVLYRDSTALWNSQTAGPNCQATCTTAFQTDGNLVVYSGNIPLWNSGSGGRTGSQLTISQNIPYLEINDAEQKLLWSSARAITHSTLCGTDVVNDMNTDAAPALLNCLKIGIAHGAKIIDIPAGHYYFSSVLDLTNLSNLKIQTNGLASGPACLDSGAGECAVFIAKTSYNDSLLLSTDASNLSLNYLALDGNIGPRQANFKNSWGANAAHNARIHGCSSCQFIGFTSTRAPHGTGLEFDGTNAVFDTVYFFENGWSATSYKNPGWADGLTIWSAANVLIQNSKFIENSDVNLILGNAPGATIRNNLIGSTYNFAFAGLMLDNFNGGQPGDFTNATITNNTIACGDGYCGVGLMLGPHIWYNSRSIVGTNALISGTIISGAKQGIYTSGANDFKIQNATITTPGAYGAANYTGCTAQPLTVATGDNIATSGVNYDLFSDLLAGCGPMALPDLIVHMANVSYDVAFAYQTILGRSPDLTGGMNATASGLALGELRAIFANSAEASSKINAAYKKVLERDADVSGLNHFKSQLASGAITVEQIPVILMQSTEALSRPYRRY